VVAAQPTQDSYGAAVSVVLPVGQQAEDSYGAAAASVLPAAQPAQDSYGSPSGASLAASSGGLPAVASNQDSYGTPLSNVLPSSDAESLATVIEGRSAAGGASNLQQDALTQSTFQGGFLIIKQLKNPPERV